MQLYMWQCLVPAVPLHPQVLLLPGLQLCCSPHLLSLPVLLFFCIDLLVSLLKNAMVLKRE